jgi:DNA-binding MarR family transcriptional regulator
MVVESNLDLGYLGLFLGLRINELVLQRGRAAGFRAMRESDGYIVQHLIESDRTITELARRMEVSQQAASKAIAGLVSRGVVESLPHDDGRARTIRLSKRGWAAVRVARAARRRLDAKLRRAVGAKQYDDLRRSLLVCLKAMGGIGRVRARRVRPPQ